MAGLLVEDHSLRNRTEVFEDRQDAGKKLAPYLKEYKNSHAIILAIPSGGVPIGKEIQKALDLDFDLLIARKVQIPWNTEAGFGAINMDGDLILNEPLYQSLNLSQEVMRVQARKAMQSITERNELFRKGREMSNVFGRPVILVDDGLASGYTMRVTIDYLKKRGPQEIVVAVPTGSADSVKRLLPEVDRFICLNVRESYPYAVASAYRYWYDLTEEDILGLLEEEGG